MMVNTKDNYAGLFTSACDNCKNERKYKYSASNDKSSKSGIQEESAMKMYNGKELEDTTFKGE